METVALKSTISRQLDQPSGIAAEMQARSLTTGAVVLNSAVTVVLDLGSQIDLEEL